MLNINNSQRNADQNHNEMLLHTCQDGYYQKNNKFREDVEKNRVSVQFQECKLVQTLWKIAFLSGY